MFVVGAKVGETKASKDFEKLVIRCDFKQGFKGASILENGCGKAIYEIGCGFKRMVPRG